VPAPLTSDTSRLAASFLRALAARQLRLRCFPQWPPDIDAVAPAYAVLREAPELVVACDGELTLNGSPFRNAPEFEALLRSRSLKSVTFRAGVEPRELDVLGGPHVDVELAAQPHDPPPDAVRPLEVDELDRLYAALRHWKTAAARLREHPPGDAATAAALGLAASAIASLLSLVPRITFATPGGPLIVNNEPLPTRHAAAAAAIARLEEILPARGIRSLTLWHGIEPYECHALTSFLAVDNRSYAEQIRATLHGGHVAFNLPEESPDSDHGLPSFPHETREEEILPLDPLEKDNTEETDNLDLRAKFLLSAPVDRFLTPEAAHEFGPALESLNTGGRAKYANRLVDRLAVYLADPEVRWRRSAYGVLAQALREAKGTSRAMLIVRSRPALAMAAATETELEPFADAASAWIAAALEAWPLQVAAEFVAQYLRARLDRDPAWKAVLLARTKSITALDPVFKALRTGPAPLREAAVRVVSAIGAPLTPRLVEFIISIDDEDARRAAAVALGEAGGQAELSKYAAEDQKLALRALSVLEAAGPNVDGAVISAIGRSERAVRDAGFALVRRLSHAAAAPILRRTLGLEPLMTLATATRMSLVELLPDVVRLARETLNDAHAFAACSYLSAVPSPSAIHALKRVFETRSKMFGLKKGLSDATRAAAISAIARIGHPDTLAILEAARDDQSELVRNAAK